MGSVHCQAQGRNWRWGTTHLQHKESNAVSGCVFALGWNECLGLQVWSKFNVSGPRLFLIQGHCVLVSINTEINTMLQSAPFINGVTHLMRALLTHINLPSRRGPSKNCRQQPAWIHSASAFGASRRPASTFSPQKTGKSETSRHDQHKHTYTHVLKPLLLAFSGYCSFFMYLFI